MSVESTIQWDAKSMPARYVYDIKFLKYAYVKVNFPRAFISASQKVPSFS